MESSNQPIFPNFNPNNLNELGHETISRINDMGHSLFGSFCDIIQPVVTQINPSVNIRESDGLTIRKYIQYERHETDGCIQFVCYLPGVKKEDLNVSLVDNTLSVSGTTSLRVSPESGRIYTWTHLREKHYSRVFKVPRDTTPENLSAYYENGVLRLVVKKNLSTASTGTNINIM